jgi:hypothetical protein
MSAVQNPPVTVITVPPETTTTTAPTTTTMEAPVTTVTEATVTTVATTEVPATTDVGQPEEGLVLVVFLGVAALAALVFLVVRALRRRGEKRAPVVIPAGASVADRVRAAAAKTRLDGPDGPDPVADVSVADLYPWLDSPEDLTLVVDLRTAEALQGVGVRSLTQLADIDNDLVRAMVDAGIDIDTRAVEAAAQEILGRRAKGEMG